MGRNRSVRDELHVSRRQLLGGVAAATAGFTFFGNWSLLFATQALGSEESLPIRLADFSQIAFVVKDIEAAAKRTAALFGVSVPKASTTDTADKTHILYRGAPTPARAKLAFFRFGSISCELIEPVGGPSTWKEALDKNGEGFHHLGFRVRDIKEALSALNTKGFETIQTGDFTGGSYAYVDTTRALGCVIELLAAEKG